MLIQHQHPDNKSIMVAVLGVPNAGKSTLVNTLLGMELNVVTKLPQTTRNKVQCIFTVDHTEIILVDTPGLHRTNKEFNKRLNEQAREGLEGTDLNLLLIDLSQDISKQILDVKETIEKELTRIWVVFTKSDILENVESEKVEGIYAKIKEFIPSVEKKFIISAKKLENINLLTGAICDAAQPGPHLFPGGEVTDKNERFFVCEYIREQAFHLLKEELPYEVAVTIDEYDDLREKEGKQSKQSKEPKIAKAPSSPEKKSKLVSKISATILVNRPSQRAIVVGAKGGMIREIGVRARKKIEAMVGGSVQLNLHVKVSPKWYKNNFVLEEIGLPRAVTSARVWRKK